MIMAKVESNPQPLLSCFSVLKSNCPMLKYHKTTPFLVFIEPINFFIYSPKP
jgi:hypothetical protein